jgi:hypothetical protein
MVMQTGMHPAAIKDSVTSTPSLSLLFITDEDAMNSPGRMHDCRSIGVGGWKG